MIYDTSFVIFFMCNCVIKRINLIYTQNTQWLPAFAITTTTEDVVVSCVITFQQSSYVMIYVKQKVKHIRIEFA